MTKKQRHQTPNQEILGMLVSKIIYIEIKII
jgi:hypothetical protein